MHLINLTFNHFSDFTEMPLFISSKHANFKFRDAYQWPFVLLSTFISASSYMKHMFC